VRGGDALEGIPHAHEADARFSPSETSGLADLIRQREEFAHDVTRIEAVLAQGSEGTPGLYERLLRSRRISGKLDNRIQLVRFQQKMRAER
jgi:hypothetical protein